MTELSEWKEMIYRNYWKQSIKKKKKKKREQNQSVTETNDKNKTNLNKHLFV